MKKNIPNKYKPFPFWSWNDELEEEELVKQIDWMHENGIGGFFMHARGGLTTPYLGEKWFKCVEACLKRAKELDMEAYAYDENGWPSGFAGGELLKDEYNRDQYLSYKIGEYDPNAFVSYDLSLDKLVRTNKGNNNLNIYLHTSASTADVCNEKVMRKFIDLTHEQYKKHDIYGNLRGFFTDEPQYYRWGTPYTRVLPDYFKEHYEEDILDRLGLLFVEKEGYRDFRYKYWKAMQDLMLHAFGKQIYDWCDENGYQLTGHYVEENSLHEQMWCCAGVMPFYEYEHIPGCDWLGRKIYSDINPKQLGSACAQLGKKQVMSEMFACVGWDATPLELKHIAEFLMVSGVNIICHHLLPYSEHGQRKRDYPEHYSKVNPWVNKDFKSFNDYFSMLGYHLSNSKEIVNVGVLQPIRSCYFNYKRDDDVKSVEDVDNSYREVVELLGAEHIPYHLLDETIMAKHARVEGKRLIVGECSYDYVIFPKVVFTMDKTTEALLHEFVNNGGKVLLLGDKPSYLEGQPHSYDYLKTNTSLDDIKSSLPFASKENKNIRISYRLDENNNPYFYIVNLGDETDLELSCKGYKSWKNDLDDRVLGGKIHFNRYESMVLYPSNEEVQKENKLNILKLRDDFDIVGPVDNYLLLDKVQYSKDGKIYSNPMSYMAIFALLLQERYQGNLYLKYNFEVKNIPSKLVALVEDLHNKELTLNGVKVEKSGTELEKDLWVYNVQKACKIGTNELILHINFIQNEDVYYALFGENVTETLKNCLAYPTTIEAIYLKGDFGVEGDFQDGNDKNIVVANKFAITEQPKHVKELIKGGFPFFRGDITLEQKIDVKDTNQLLVFDKRFQMIDAYVNDKFVERLIFKYKVDLSKYLKVGENNIRLVLSVSNRNLLGIHHHPEEEPLAIGPHSFERFGTWDKDGKSPFYKERYSFVKTII